ncbi:unnamed protein product [Protopolystoma xenopodis]|uniref:Uncharacterized protein n=1 Tax=Protopolystoma xenopodis TaxID=117903 RepID=A0A3S5CNY9_9PLAT|nr:unnamed protein product [Protopolystoma xenopodis]
MAVPGAADEEWLIIPPHASIVMCRLLCCCKSLNCQNLCRTFFPSLAHTKAHMRLTMGRTRWSPLDTAELHCQQQEQCCPSGRRNVRQDEVESS